MYKTFKYFLPALCCSILVSNTVFAAEETESSETVQTEYETSEETEIITESDDEENPYVYYDPADGGEGPEYIDGLNPEDLSKQPSEGCGYMISTKPDLFNVSQMIQFFTRTRYDVPATTLIKKTCYRKDGNNPKAVSRNKIKAIIHNLMAPSIQGSYNGSKYIYNETLTGTDSFLGEADHLTDDLSYFDKQQNRLVEDEFAVSNCASNICKSGRLWKGQKNTGIKRYAQRY